VEALSEAGQPRGRRTDPRIPGARVDIDIFDHMNNSVYGASSRTACSANPELRTSRSVTIEHDLPVSLGDKLEIISHVYPAGSTEQFGARTGGPHC